VKSEQRSAEAWHVRLMKKNHKQKKRKKRESYLLVPPGTPPGTVIVHPEAAPPTIRVLAYGPTEVLEEKIVEVRRVRDFLDKQPVTWVDVEGLGDASTIHALGEVFGVHRLALEDIVTVHQRPKVEQYGEQLFIVARAVYLGEQLDTEQVSLFVGKNFVLTFQEGRPGDCLEAIRERIRKRGGRIRDAGHDYLAYALLDTIVDSYFPILEECGERLETLEDEILLRPQHDTVARIHGVKRDLLALRRAMWPQRETLNSLLRDETPVMTAETRLYLRDCYDHSVQILDLLETYRELGSDLIDMYLSMVSNRTNEIMRVLTVISVIFIPLTFIAGVYGMNFDTEKSFWNMPELKWYFGYPFALLLMLTVTLGQLIFFRRRGWLGSPRGMVAKEEQRAEET
jgi:magnesium transporter